jgi:hypothetical protein
MIAKARHVTRRWHGSYEPRQIDWIRDEGWVLVPRGDEHEAADEKAVRLHDHLKVCSCEHCGCGNPRRWRGSNGPALTVQELRVAGDLRAQLEEGGDE